MRVFAIYPGLNPTYDEVFHALPPLLPEIQVSVVTTRMSALKTQVLASDYENSQGIDIFRPYGSVGELAANPEGICAEIVRMYGEAKPDLIFANSTHSLPLALHLQSVRKVPLLLRMESAAPLTLVKRRYYAGWKPLGRLVGRLKWWRLCAQVDAIMVSDPADIPVLGRLDGWGSKTFYAGHCAQRLEGARQIERNRGEMIYVGSLIRHKNCDRWLRTVPLIFENTPVERFTIIGRGPYQPVVEKLRKRFGDRIHPIESVTRQEALERISGAYFAYTESDSGWGFLCDAWSSGTPLLCPQSTFCIVPGWTGMMPRNDVELVQSITRLYEEPGYYETMQSGGAARYRAEHTAEVVAKQYRQIFFEVAAMGRGRKGPVG